MGAALLLAAWAPHLPGGAFLAEVGPLDVRHAPLVASGILLLVAATGPLVVARAAAATNGEADAGRLGRWAGAGGMLGLVAALAFLAIAIGLPPWTTAEMPAVGPALFAGVGLAVPVPLIAGLLVGVFAGPGQALPVRGAAVVIGGVLIAFGVIVAVAMVQDAPFSWDEAVYALTTRHWVQGTPDTGWGVHRPPVLSALGVAPLAFGTDEALFRVITMGFGIGAVAATAFLAWSVAGPTAAVVASAAVAAAPSIQIDAGLFLNDVPAMAILLLGMALAWRLLERPGPIGWEILWLAPIAAAAFYVRYGSVLALAAIGLTVAILWPRRLLDAWPRALATVVLLALLLVPHAIFATITTGSPLGVAFRAQSGAAGDFLGAGLLQYLAWLPAPLVGAVPGAIAVIGLIGVAWRLASAALRRAWSPPVRAAIFLALPAMLLFLVLGLLQLPQGRYVFLPMVLLIVAGSAVLARAIRLKGLAGRGVAAATVAALAAGLATSAVDMPARADARAAVYEWIREAGGQIRAQSDGSCSILASDVPQLTWYSGCETYSFAGGASSDRDELLTGADRFLVVRRDNRFQPAREVMQAYLSRVDPEPFARLENRSGVVIATVYRFR